MQLVLLEQEVRRLLVQLEQLVLQVVHNHQVHLLLVQQEQVVHRQEQVQRGQKGNFGNHSRN